MNGHNYVEIFQCVIFLLSNDEIYSSIVCIPMRDVFNKHEIGILCSWNPRSWNVNCMNTIGEFIHLTLNLEATLVNWNTTHKEDTIVNRHTNSNIFSLKHKKKGFKNTLNKITNAVYSALT